MEGELIGLERTREEILPGVWLTALKTDKFKTGLLSVSLLGQLEREDAALNALFPNVLRRGSASYPDMDAVAARLDSLYGATVSPVVRRVGEIQAVGFASSFAADDFVPEGQGLAVNTAETVMELLLAPQTRGGLLLPDYVDSERSKLIERIRARKNDKGSYAVSRLLELMCQYEDFSVYPLGDEESAAAIRYPKLTKHYRERLALSPIEIFYCGGAELYRLRSALRSAMEILPRGETDFDIGTDVRMNAVEAQPREFTEEMDVSQGKLAIGWRLGECMDEPNEAAIRVFNAVFGGSVNSKLFSNVREKLSLCYYASSGVDLHKGLLLVSSGIEFDKFDSARDEIFAQLEAMKRGEITDEELDSARLGESGDLLALCDDPGALEGYWLGHNIDGDDCSPEELAALCDGVTRESVVEIARSVECDAVYFLRGRDGEDDGDDEE